MAQLIAALAALTAFAALSWQVYLRLSDRGRLRVEIILVQNQTSQTEIGNEFWCSVVNVGRRPIIAASISFRFEKMETSVVAPYRGLPLRLNEGEGGRIVVEQQDVFGALVDAYATDSVGRRFRMKRKHLNRLREQVKSKLSGKVGPSPSMASSSGTIGPAAVPPFANS